MSELSAVAFQVHGDAVPKQSFRVTGKGGYSDPRVKSWQATVSQWAGVAMRQSEPFSGPVKVRLQFYLKNRRRVDLDNLSKAVLDGMNGIVFRDDTQVVDLHITKDVKSDDPQVWVNVERIRS